MAAAAAVALSSWLEIVAPEVILEPDQDAWTLFGDPALRRGLRLRGDCRPSGLNVAIDRRQNRHCIDCGPAG